MKALYANIVIWFCIAFAPFLLTPNDTVQNTYAYAQYIPNRIAPPPIYHPGAIFESQGGYLNEFHGLREHLRKSRGLVRLGHCASACTTLLSLPNVCVYPGATFLFHAARRPGGFIDPNATAEMFRQVPAPIRGLLRPPFDGLDQVFSGAQLIMSGGARPCPY